MANIVITVSGVTGTQTATHGAALNLPYWACKALKKWVSRTYKYVTGATVSVTIVSNATTSNFKSNGDDKLT